MKKLQKGFTLIELIVVMAIMGIIMTVIMSIINPTSRIASRVESMKDEETVAISVGRAVKSELEFATKVYVVGKDDSETLSGVPSDLKYVYVINNSEARPSSRKGAKGVITLGTWDGTSISNEAVVMQEANWFEDEYQIGIEEFNTTPGNYYIQLNFRGYRMIAENGAYVMDGDSTYRYGEAINFVNINNRDEIKKGGNTGAANFTCEINGDSLRPAAGKAYKDKIYIFFNPASETALSVGGGTLYTTTSGSGGGTSPAGGGGTTAGGGTSATTTTSAPSLGNVNFINDDSTVQVKALNHLGVLVDGLPSDNGAQPVSTIDYDWEWVGWFTNANPTDLNNKVNASQTFAGNTTLYSVWRKVPKHKVTFLDFEGNSFEVQYVVDGQAAQMPANNPTPTDSSKVFNYWEDASGNQLGKAITADTTYTPTMTAAKGLMYIHFLTSYQNGRLVVKESSDFTIDGTQYKDYKELAGFSKTTGDVITIKVNAGSANVCLYHENSWNEIANFTVNSINGERHVYYYLEKDGNFRMSDNQPDIYQSVVLFHIKPGDEPADNTVYVSNKDDGAWGRVQWNEANGAMYTSKDPIALKISDGQSIVAHTNLKIKANNNAFFTVYDNNDPYELYLYTDLDGTYKIDTTPWVQNSKLTVNFLENVEGNQIELSQGDYYFNDTTNKGNNEWNSFFSDTYGLNKSLTFKYLQNSTLRIGGATYTLGNDGGNYTVTYYNGSFYNNADDAKAKYQEDHAGQNIEVDGITLSGFGEALPSNPFNDKNLLVIDVPSSYNSKYMFLGIYNVKVKIYEATTGTVLLDAQSDNNYHVDISKYTGKNARFYAVIDCYKGYGQDSQFCLWDSMWQNDYSNQKSLSSNPSNNGKTTSMTW